MRGVGESRPVDGGGGSSIGFLPLDGDLSGTTSAANVIGIAGSPVITDFVSLEAAFPAVAGLHTINKTTFWPGTTLIPLPAGNRILWTAPNVIMGNIRVGVVGNYTGPLCSGPITIHGGFTSHNQDIVSGTDWAIDGTAGVPISLDGLSSLGKNAGTIENVSSLVIKACGLFPQVPGGTGFVLDGTIGDAIIDQTITVAPGVSPYTAWTVAPTATVTTQIVVATTTFQSALAGDTMFDLSTAATYPDGVLPTSTVGLFFQSPSLTGPGRMYAAGSVDAADIRLVSISPNNGPASRFLGDATVDTTGTPPSIILVNNGSPANTKLVVPVDNSGNGGVGPTLRTLALDPTISQRHTIVVTGVQNWGIRYDGALRDIPTSVSWTAIIRRVGAIANVNGWVQYNDGGGWTTIERTKATVSALTISPQTTGRSAVPFTMSPGTQFRLVFDTDTPATDTAFESYEVTIDGRSAGG